MFSAVERLNTTIFSEIYEKNDIKQLFFDNQFYFYELARIVIQSKFYESFLQSDSFNVDIDCKDFRNFLKLCGTIC